MFAVSHAATALPLKRQFPRANLWSLLIAVQAIELLWVILTYIGVEHIVFSNGRIHLGFLPYSHSVASTLALAVLAWAVIASATGRRDVAAAVAIGIVTHIVLDIIQHEPDIQLLPLAWGPRLGLGLTLHPIVDVLVETAYCIACWAAFGGGRALLVALVLLNVSDLPFLYPDPGVSRYIAMHPAVLTTVIVGQIIVSWALVATFARDGKHRSP